MKHKNINPEILKDYVIEHRVYRRPYCIRYICDCCDLPSNELYFLTPTSPEELAFQSCPNCLEKFCKIIYPEPKSPSVVVVYV